MEESRLLEYHKALLDYLKHITTLSTGSIILIATFLEKIFQKPMWKAAVVVSLIGFMVSTLFATIAYTIGLIFEFPKQETPGNLAALGMLSLILTWLGFLVGILSLAIFALRNFLQ
jgi:lipid-A-disaccharide synthase-like uncharacterized protein